MNLGDHGLAGKDAIRSLHTELEARVEKGKGQIVGDVS